jgi:hypothetical protein
MGALSQSTFFAEYIFAEYIPAAGPASMTSLPPTTTQTIRTRIRSKLSEFLWPLVWVAILVSAGGISLRAVSVMTQNPPLPDCTQVSANTSDSEKLLCAQASVRSGSAQALIEAIELVEPWEPSNPQYEEANRLMNSWSKALLNELDNMAQQGDIQQVRVLAKRIPERVEIYPQVKGAIATWDKEWAVGEEFEADVLKAIQVGNWVSARQNLQSLEGLNTHYWVRIRHDQLEEKIDREETGRIQLDKARSLAKTGDLKKLGEAFAIAQEINLETIAWREAKPDVEQWAERVMQYSFQKWEAEDIDAAIAIVQMVPPDMALTAEAKDLLSYGHAQRLAKGRYDQWTPSYGQVYNLLEAIQAVQRISPDSPFYNEAQESLGEWQQKLDDMVQLQYASTLARMGQRPTYQMAIAKAEQITQERPQRTQAQTLVSHWKKEIQRLEDQPILNRAVRLASAGGKANLTLAIAEANKVKQGRALRVQGQTYIAEWVDRIEIIEDQPIVTKAKQLAAKGELAGAIAEAQKVKKGRALYKETQVAIKDWVAEIQTIEDSPILAQAESLAARGSLSAAIETAAQIAPGRALSDEASASIAIWAKEREYIWSLDAPAADSAPGSALDSGPYILDSAPASSVDAPPSDSYLEDSYSEESALDYSDDGL